MCSLSPSSSANIVLFFCNVITIARKVRVQLDGGCHDRFDDYSQGLSDPPPQAGRGHVTPHMPVARDGEVLVITKNRTLPFSKACPNPPQKWAKTYITHQRTREFLQLEGQRRQHSHPPTHLVLFLVTTSILSSLQAYAELHALSPVRRSISP